MLYCIVMRRDAFVLCLLITLSIIYFDLFFYNGFEITEKYGLEIQKALFGIESNTANAQFND